MVLCKSLYYSGIRLAILDYQLTHNTIVWYPNFCTQEVIHLNLLPDNSRGFIEETFKIFSHKVLS